MRVDVAALALAVAITFALSPALLDLVQHWIAQPWARYSVVFVPLTFAWVLHAEAIAPRRDGAIAIVVGIVLAALLVAGGLHSWARVGIPIAILGLCRMRGLAPLSTASLAIFIVPMPSLLNRFTGPEWPELLAGAAAWVVALFASGLEIAEGVARLGDRELAIAPQDGGLALAFLLVGAAWARALQEGAISPGARALQLGGWALLFAPLQLGVWVTALAALSVSGPAAARNVLDGAPLLLAAGAALLLVAGARAGGSEVS
jgi:hypothetical protein